MSDNYKLLKLPRFKYKFHRKEVVKSKRKKWKNEVKHLMNKVVVSSSVSESATTSASEC